MRAPAKILGNFPPALSLSRRNLGNLGNLGNFTPQGCEVRGLRFQAKGEAMRASREILSKFPPTLSRRQKEAKCEAVRAPAKILRKFVPTLSQSRRNLGNLGNLRRPPV